VLRTVRDQHADLGLSTSDAAVTAALEAIGRAPPPSMTRDDAWPQLARINPLLAEGHLAIALTHWRADTAAHRAAGGALFPFDVATRRSPPGASRNPTSPPASTARSR